MIHHRFYFDTAEKLYRWERDLPYRIVKGDLISLDHFDSDTDSRGKLINWNELMEDGNNELEVDYIISCPFGLEVWLKQ